MANFCTKCGKELKDNKPCNCKKNFEKEEKTINLTNSLNFNEVINIFKNMIKKPVDTTKEMVNKNNLDLSIILIGISSLFFGIFMMIYLKEMICCNYGYNMFSINIPYFKYFMLTIITVVLAYLTISSIIYLLAKINNQNIEFKKTLNLVSISFIPIVMAVIINIFVIYISLPLVIFITFISIIISIINLYIGMKEIVNLDDNKIIYLLSLSLVVSIFIYLIFIF